MQEVPKDENGIWIALIGAAAAILGALRVDRWPVLFFSWLKSLNNGSSKAELKELEAEAEELKREMKRLRDSLTEERMSVMQMRLTFKAMVPLMRQMMSDSPAHVELLNQLENSIFENVTPTDGIHERTLAALSAEAARENKKKEKK